MLRIVRSRGLLDRAVQVACLSWAALTVTVLTPPLASATIAWRDTPNGSLSTTVHAMADDGTSAHVVASLARGFELSPDGAWAPEVRG